MQSQCTCISPVGTAMMHDSEMVGKFSSFDSLIGFKSRYWDSDFLSTLTFQSRGRMFFTLISRCCTYWSSIVTRGNEHDQSAKKAMLDISLMVNFVHMWILRSHVPGHSWGLRYVPKSAAEQMRRTAETGSWEGAHLRWLFTHSKSLPLDDTASIMCSLPFITIDPHKFLISFPSVWPTYTAWDYFEEHPPNIIEHY